MPKEDTQFKPGNPGKPKGAISIKQQIKQFYQVNPEELHKRIARLATSAKYDDIYWKMIEGMPKQQTDVTVKQPIPILPSKTVKGIGVAASTKAIPSQTNTSLSNTDSSTTDKEPTDTA